jgi:hypothetical protein
MPALGIGERERKTEPSASRSSLIGDTALGGPLALALGADAAAASPRLGETKGFGAEVPAPPALTPEPETGTELLLALAFEATAAALALGTPPEPSWVGGIDQSTRMNRKFTERTVSSPRMHDQREGTEGSGRFLPDSKHQARRLPMGTPRAERGSGTGWNRLESERGTRNQ